jgi:ferric-dicitrate binding protein FerR (iron transport regulator)
MADDQGMAGTRRALLIGAGAAFATLPLRGAAFAQDPAGVVDAVAGEAHAVAAAGMRKLATQASIFVGDLLTTGAASRLGVALGKTTSLRLGSEAKLKIDRFIVDAGGEFTLEAGVLRFDKPAPGKAATKAPDLTFRSVYGVIAVRGTRFHAGQDRGRFAVFVDRGSVSVTAAGRTVIVDAGQGTDIASPGSAPSRPRIWPAGRVRAFRATVA